MTDIPDPATDALQMAKIVSVNKWKTVVANTAHVTRERPADMILGTHLMMHIAEVPKGVYVGFTHMNEEAIIRDLSKAQNEFEEKTAMS